MDKKGFFSLLQNRDEVTVGCLTQANHSRDHEGHLAWAFSSKGTSNLYVELVLSFYFYYGQGAQKLEVTQGWKWPKSIWNSYHTLGLL